jgi:hypothetical protein
VRVVLVVDQMADPAQLRTAQQRVEPTDGPVRLVEGAPGDDSADPRQVPGHLEHVVGVLVERGTLHEHRARNTGRGEQRLEVRRLEGARDDGVLLRHPGLRDARRVPEVVVSVDCHGGDAGPAAKEGTPRGPLSDGDYLAFAFVTSAVPVSTFFNTFLPVTAL